MKKVLIILVTIMACAGFSARADKSALEQSFTNEVKKFLVSEGYAPTIDEDGDVKFKYEGDTFFVIVATYGDGYYVKVVGFMDASDTGRRGVLEACNETERSLRYVRCYLNNQNDIVYECAGFFANLYQFKLMFPDFMSVLKSSDKKLKEVYNEFDN